MTAKQKMKKLPKKRLLGGGGSKSGQNTIK
jgi:hypothetical protein